MVKPRAIELRLRLPTAEESEQLIQARTAVPDDAD